MSIARLARPNIRALNPYEAATQVDDTVRLNANEAPWRNRAGSFRRPLNRYPEVRPEGLRYTLARRFQCDPNRLLVTRGTSEAIDLLIRTFCRANQDSIVTTAPTFSMYAHYAAIQGATVHEVATDAQNDFAIDVDAVLQRCDSTTRLIFLCSPNNPTGTILERDAIEEILKGRAGNSAVIVDEAYIEFSTSTSAIELLDRYDNLIVLRTLSKALAFAGARCGAVIGPADVINLLNAVQAPYALATPVIECVEDALQDKWISDAEAHVDEIISERERMITEISKLPFANRVWPSEANFFLVEFANSSTVLEQVQADKVLLRSFGGLLEHCVRITVGTRDENECLLQSLAKVTGS